jgi:DNA polymerase-3 subunit epsilon
MEWKTTGNAKNPSVFVAIDFETADRGSDSACAVALVRVEGLRIVGRQACLLRPPRQRFLFTYVHGITWEDVADAAPFVEAWPGLSRLVEGATFFAAHNAWFDRNVLHACCRAAALPMPALPFACTMQLARKTWGIYPTKLPHVCARLGIPLRHHDPASDAEACARIVIEASRSPRRMRTGNWDRFERRYTSIDPCNGGES